MKKILLYAAFALALVSCVQEWSLEEVRTEEGLVERTWTVAMDDGTRATLDETLRPVWEVGEELSVYDHVAHVGRIFVVQSVEGNCATITGGISAGGDTPFDAVYPAKSVGGWSSDGTSNSLKLPETQLIPAGRNVCPDVLVSTAHSDSPEGSISFHNISSLLKVQVNLEGIADISIDLAGPSEDELHGYRAAAASGTRAPGTYFVAVDPGTYSGGVSVVCSDGFGQEYHRSSSTPLEAAAGGILNLGKVSDWKARRYYNVMAEKTYAGQDDLLENTGLMGMLDSSTASQLPSMLGLFFRNRTTPARAISYSYLSADPQGLPVELSAVVYVREAVLEKTVNLKGITIANHGTIAANYECPTERAQFEGAFAWKDHAIVMADYYGFGISQDRPQAYLDPETTARGNIDAYLAAVQLLSDLEVEVPSVVYNAGYSQGGFNAMANLRYVSQHPGLGITFKKTMCGGSPFNVGKTWEKFLQGEYRNAMAFVPVTLVSFNEAQRLGLDYSKLFKGELLANWREWVLSKKYSLSSIVSKIGSTELSDILADGMMSLSGAEYNTVLETCNRFSLTSGWVHPAEGSWIFIYHSTTDDTVPYENLEWMRSYLEEVDPDADITWKTADNGGHIKATLFYIISIVNQW